MTPEELRTPPEEREVIPDTTEEDRWHARAAADELAREQDRLAEAAFAALDELAALVASHDESGAEVDLDHLRDILRTGRHRDYLPDDDRGWCGTGE